SGFAFLEWWDLRFVHLFLNAQPPDRKYVPTFSFFGRRTSSWLSGVFKNRGSAGDSPAPVGDSPTGMRATPRSKTTLVARTVVSPPVRRVAGRHMRVALCYLKRIFQTRSPLAPVRNSTVSQARLYAHHCLAVGTAMPSAAAVSSRLMPTK